MCFVLFFSLRARPVLFPFHGHTLIPNIKKSLRHKVAWFEAAKLLWYKKLMEQQLFMQITRAHVLWPRHILVSDHSFVRSLGWSVVCSFLSFHFFLSEFWFWILMFFKYSLFFIHSFVSAFSCGSYFWNGNGGGGFFSWSDCVYCSILLLSCSFDFGSFHFSMLLKQRFFLSSIGSCCGCTKAITVAASTYDMDYDRLSRIIISPKFVVACPVFCLIEKNFSP